MTKYKAKLLLTFEFEARTHEEAKLRAHRRFSDIYPPRDTSIEFELKEE